MLTSGDEKQMRATHFSISFTALSGVFKNY